MRAHLLRALPLKQAGREAGHDADLPDKKDGPRHQSGAVRVEHLAEVLLCCPSRPRRLKKRGLQSLQSRQPTPKARYAPSERPIAPQTRYPMMRDHAMMPSDSFLANEIIHKRKKTIVFLYSIIYISFIYFIQNFIVELPVLCLYLILFIFTVLLFIFLSYECVIEKTKTLMTLHPEGRLTRLLSGRMLLHIFCFIIALFLPF